MIDLTNSDWEFSAQQYIRVVGELEARVPWFGPAVILTVDPGRPEKGKVTVAWRHNFGNYAELMDWADRELENFIADPYGLAIKLDWLHDQASG